MISFTIRWWQIHVFMPMLTVFHFKVSGETPGNCIQHWMISLEGHIICEGIQTVFCLGLLLLHTGIYSKVNTWMHTFNSLHFYLYSTFYNAYHFNAALHKIFHCCNVACLIDTTQFGPN